MKDTRHYRELLGRFKSARVMVVGDIYLDENVHGVMTGISLEAPIPIYEVHERRYNPGAAGNAACNVAALGARTYMVGYVGQDSNAAVVQQEFHARNVDTSCVVTHPDRPTNTYGKLRAGGFNHPPQEVLRTDTPRPAFIDGDVEDQIVANIRNLAPEVDAIVVVDQVSSVATERVIETVATCAAEHKLITVGDSRERAGAFRGFDVVVPNDREAGIGVGIDVVDDETLRQAGRELLKRCKNALVTCGPDGVQIFAEDGSLTRVPILIDSSEVRDVTGAGDTVTATVAVALVAGATLEEAALLGNAAAGVAVRKPGVVTVTPDEMLEILQGEGGPTKLKSLDELKAIVAGMRAEGKRVVWTNGVFDIMHVGHIRYLVRAAALGDVLIVGLNSDKSVREIKGEKRPIVSEKDRTLVLSALECVDYVTVFNERTPEAILEALQPDVYAKGGDYTIDTVVQPERRLVEAYGGVIRIIPGVEGQSTTAIINRIMEAQR